MKTTRFGTALLLSVATAIPVAGAQLAAPTAALACNGVTGKIDGATKCLRAGEFGKKAAAKEYPKYGFKCTKQDANGRWHLVAA